MKKIITSLLLTTLILTFNVYGYEPYISNEIVKISPFEFVEKDTDKVIENLVPKTEVSVKTSVKKGANEEIPTVTLVLALYSDGTFMTYKEKEIILDKNKKDVSLDMLIPDGENLSLKAFLFDDLSNARPLASSGISDENNNEVVDIIVDNKPISNFKNDIKEYNISVPATHKNFPEVSVIPLNSDCKVLIEVSGMPEDKESKAVIKVISKDKRENIFTLNYIKEDPAVTNAYLNIPGKDPVKLNTGKVEEPLWDEDKKPAGMPEKYGFNQNDNEAFFSTNLPKKSSLMYTDRNWYYVNISPELMGGTTVITPYNLKDNSDLTDTSINNLITFDINKSATVYLHINGATWNQLNDAGFTYDLNQPKADRMMQYPTFFNYQVTYFYSRDYEVKDGEKVTVSLPYISPGNMYGIVVKFKDNEIIDNANLKRKDKLYKADINSNIFEPYYYNKDLLIGEEGKFFYNIKNYTTVFKNTKLPVPYNFDSDFIGGNLIILPKNINPMGRSYETLSFDLNMSSEVLLLWNDNTDIELIKDYLLNDNWQEAETSLMLCNENSSEEFLKVGVAFRKIFYVKPGEKEHVDMFKFPASSGQFIVMARPVKLN